jgi:5-carboxyvanillate decarboxylase
MRMQNRRQDHENHRFRGSFLYTKLRQLSEVQEGGTKGRSRCIERSAVVAWKPYLPADVSVEEKLVDTGRKRIEEMDASGVNVQVLSLANPGVEQFEPSDGTAMARQTNDELSEVIKKHPDRYIGLAALAPQDPQGAASELERAVKTLGFKGAKINSHVRGEYLDHKKYRVIFEMAAKLDVPIYLHPNAPSPTILKPYADYNYPLAGPPFGFGAETSLHAMRLIYSGLFDEFPSLKIVLGHLGEGLPFWLFRIDFYWLKTLAEEGLMPKISKKPSDYVKNNFIFTSSGMQFLPAFICAYQAVGADVLAFGAACVFPCNNRSSRECALENLP